MPAFDPDRFYVTTDSELLLLGTPNALAQRRTRGEGPRYLRVGRRILYRGRDLNEFLDECVIEPACRRGRSDRNEPAPGFGKADAVRDRGSSRRGVDLDRRADER